MNNFYRMLRANGRKNGQQLVTMWFTVVFYSVRMCWTANIYKATESVPSTLLVGVTEKGDNVILHGPLELLL